MLEISGAHQGERGWSSQSERSLDFLHKPHSKTKHMLGAMPWQSYTEITDIKAKVRRHQGIDICKVMGKENVQLELFTMK